MDSIQTWTTAVIAAVVFVYAYFKHKHSFWRKKGIPTPPIKPIVGNVFDNSAGPLHEVMLSNSKKLGKTYGIYQVTRPILVTSDSELIKHVTIRDAQTFINHPDMSDLFGDTAKQMLFNIHDDHWRRIRHIMTATFTSGKMKGMFAGMKKCSQDATTAFEAYLGEDIDLRKFVGRYSIDVIASTCFASKLDCYNRTKSNAFVDNAGLVFKPNSFNFLLYIGMPRWLFKAIGIKVFPPGPMQYFEDIVKKLMRQRKDSQVEAKDFFQLLVDATEGKLDVDTKSKSMTEDELVAQAVAFLSAGHDTTSIWLSFIFYLLALNPECQEKLYQSLQRDAHLDYDQLVSHSYLDAVLNETLRLYPPVLVLSRVASADYTLPGTDVTIPRGTEIHIPSWTVHYDPKNFESPEKYDPMRFMPENKDKVKPCTFLTFGSGIRNCIGQRFAQVETKVLVADMVTKFKFFATDKTPMIPKFKPGVGQLDYEPLYVGILKR
ncbi:Cytochrome P450 9e2 [Halotydeus destructor]|nr:Cytochrome P450 9e2 [Halotydeus destructor]